MARASGARGWRVPGRKPSGIPRIDLSHPLSRLLMGAWLMSGEDGRLIRDVAPLNYSPTGLAPGVGDATAAGTVSRIPAPYGPGILLGGTTSDYVEAPAHRRYDGTTGTVVFGFRMDADPGAAQTVLLSRSDNASLRGFNVYRQRTTVNDQKLGIVVKDTLGGVSIEAYSPSVIVLGQWHQGVVQFQSGSSAVRVGLDGAMGTASGSFTWSFNGQVVRFGRSLDAFWHSYQGAFSHILWWNRILSDAEIAYLYRDPFPMLLPGPRERRQQWIVILPQPQRLSVVEGEGEDISVVLRSQAKIAVTEDEGEDISVRLHNPSTLQVQEDEGEDIIIRLTRPTSLRVREGEGERIHVALRAYPPEPSSGVHARPLVRLIWTAEIETDLPVTSLSWTAAVARQDGAAEIAVPPNSPALSNAYIRPGRSAVVITDSVLGVWRGRLMRAGRQTGGGATLQAVHVTALFKRVMVSSGIAFTSVPAGIVARAAIHDAAAQLGQVLLRAGSFVEAPPLVTYELNNKPLDQVLSELMDRSGQEWVYSDEGVFSWVAQAGRYIGRILAHDGDIIVDSGDEDGTNMLDSVSTRTPDGTLLTARVEV